MTEGLLERAILNVRTRLIPSLSNKAVSIPEPHTQLYGLLQVYDLPSDDTKGKVKYIYDYLLENGGEPKDQVVDIHSKIGALSDTPFVERVYKYLRLREQSRRALRHYKALERDLRAFHGTRRQK